jgi:hypothetical protein
MSKINSSSCSISGIAIELNTGATVGVVTGSAPVVSAPVVPEAGGSYQSRSSRLA